MAEILCYWDSSFGRGTWVLTCHDVEGNQLWEAQYFPNKAALAYALKHL